MTRARTSGALVAAVVSTALAVTVLAGVLWFNGVQERDLIRTMQAQDERGALIHATLETQDTAAFALRLNALQEAGFLEADDLAAALAVLPPPGKPTTSPGSTVPLDTSRSPTPSGALGSAVPTALPQSGIAATAQDVLLERIATADPDVATPHIEFLLLTGLLAKGELLDRPTYADIPGLPELDAAARAESARATLGALERDVFARVERSMALFCGTDRGLSDGVVSSLDSKCFVETLAEDPVCLLRAIAAQAPAALRPLRDAGLAPVILLAPWAVPCPDDIALAEQLAGRELQ
ncbi:hypothetical protein [Tropicimonas sp. S265A]|uniref:hypothetical protein n=1 Tax=Tropicimonas sp. S265A TaxID=3415134 RepID=UPI003C7E8854